MGKQHFLHQQNFFLNIKIWHSRYFKHSLRSGEHISINILHFWPPPGELGSIWQKSRKSQKSWKIRFFQKIAIFLSALNHENDEIWLEMTYLSPRKWFGTNFEHLSHFWAILGKIDFLRFLDPKKFQFCWCGNCSNRPISAK